MLYEITDDCSLCGRCADECQITAIKEEGQKYEIDQGICVACGACVFICDEGAIVKVAN
ncbi:Ferredoxin [Desulfosarcina cetonica]|uniref:Ferredoxin n=1 Tax=Desulfosarcina ovata subsp. sediminis TaxID=885957 RepID=A0A5K7ZRC2_9BACT|nr:ferredoxin [Desulfosarcina ovata subsp. sediminis]VTR70465.1 Ferredoxin [Desulfosarcina cetonica]